MSDRASGSAFPPVVDRTTWRKAREELVSNGRPIAQWPRIEAGRSDDLT